MPPKWRELADKLAAQIRAGEYGPGDQLPYIRDLVEAGEGSKSTIHAAYKALETEGLVSSSRGHGTVVQEGKPVLPEEGQGVEYFFIITLDTGIQSLQFTNTVEFDSDSTELSRYETVYEAACLRHRRDGHQVPDGVPVTFYYCQPN